MASPVSLGGLRDFMPHRQQLKYGDRDDDEEHHSEYRAGSYQYKSTEGECRNREHSGSRTRPPLAIAGVRGRGVRGLEGR
jgi:hypothetical protein